MASYLDKAGLKTVWSRVIDQINASILNSIYPVGSIYMSMNPTSPASFIGGTWEQISQGRFLLGASDDYKAGEIGGEYSHTLTVDEMPTHMHPQVGSDPTVSPLGGGTDHRYGIAYSDIGVWSDQRCYVGGGKAHNNMPPYYVVYMWKRTK